MALISPFMTPEREHFRDNFQRFVESEIHPHIEKWEADKAVPAELDEKWPNSVCSALGCP